MEETTQQETAEQPVQQNQHKSLYLSVAIVVVALAAAVILSLISMNKPKSETTVAQNYLPTTPTVTPTTSLTTQTADQTLSSTDNDIQQALNQMDTDTTSLSKTNQSQDTTDNNNL